MKENNETLTLLNNIYPRGQSTSTFEPMLIGSCTITSTKTAEINICLNLQILFYTHMFLVLAQY